MELHVQKTSRQTIKPATPTPSHLKLYKLSLLDQLSPLVYGHTLYCYSPSNGDDNDNDNDEGKRARNMARLKESLAEALSIYYPLAGRLTPDESAIDCNDEGIPFVEARVVANSSFATLSSYLQSASRVDMIPYFLPNIGNSNSDYSLTVLEMVMFAIQVTTFDCGGVIVGTKGLNKSHDGCSCGSFLTCWADLVCGRRNDKRPDFVSSAYTFPPRTWAVVSPPRPPVPLWDIDRNKVDGTCVVRVFEFSLVSLSALQEIGRSDGVPNPTRIEAVSGFIWKHCMSAAAASSGSPMFGPSVITHAMDLRRRIKPQLSPAVFGNLVIQAHASYKGHENHSTTPVEPELSDLVARIRAGLSRVKDAGFLGSLQGDEGTEVVRKYNQHLEDLRNEIETNTYRFFSWCSLGMIQDFGLGVPVWAGYNGGRMSCAVNNLILLIDNPGGCGIEAWLTLDEKEMDILESDPKFLAFASSSGPLA